VRLSAAVLLALTACASGPQRLMGQPIKKQVAVLLRVENDASGDQFGGIGAIGSWVLTTALSETIRCPRDDASSDVGTSLP